MEEPHCSAIPLLEPQFLLKARKQMGRVVPNVQTTGLPNLGPPVPFYRFFFGGGFPYSTRLQKKVGSLIQSWRTWTPMGSRTRVPSRPGPRPASLSESFRRQRLGAGGAVLDGGGLALRGAAGDAAAGAWDAWDRRQAPTPRAFLFSVGLEASMFAEMNTSIETRGVHFSKHGSFKSDCSFHVPGFRLLNMFYFPLV